MRRKKADAAEAETRPAEPESERVAFYRRLFDRIATAGTAGVPHRSHTSRTTRAQRPDGLAWLERAVWSEFGGDEWLSQV